MSDSDFVEKGSQKDWGDPIKWPFHYNRGDVQCIDALRSARPDHFRSFCVLTAIQYLWRAAYKDQELEDLRKAIWYIRMALGDDPRKD